MSRRPARARLLGASVIPVALLVLGLVMLSQPSPADANLTTVYVRKSGADTPSCGSSALSACLTITYALNKAPTGQLLNVGPGTFTENLTITKNIYIQGAGTGATIIDGNAAWHVVTTYGNYTASLAALTVRNGYMTSTTSNDNGGGIFNYLGTMNLSNVDVVSNTVNVPSCTEYCGGGGINNYGGTVTMVGGTIGWNHGGSGGGILNRGTLYLSGVVLANNESAGSSGYGAGIYSTEGARATLDNVTIRNNNAVETAGGIFNLAVMTITQSTISNNTASGNGGIQNFGSAAVMTITNSTVSSNTGTPYGIGSISSSGGSALTLNGVTIAGNQETNTAGIVLDAYSSLSIYNTILSNSGSNCDISGTHAVSHGYNLISDATCPSLFNATGDITNTNPLLAPLSNWGGTTQTHALYPGSPALNRRLMSPVDPYACTTTDQRGVARPYSSYCDTGAFEGVLSVLNLPLIIKH